MTPPIRLIHVSDLHFSARPRLLRPAEWAGKRFTGWAMGTATGRFRRFRSARTLVGAAIADVLARRPDAVIFTGDATSLALPAEFAAAAAALRVDDPAMPPAVAVPGNHDYYTRRAVRAGGFEAAFAAWQVGERVGGHVYPLARRVGHAWLVAVNSATPNRFPADASGEVGAAQLDRLRELCAGLAPGPRLLVTHYPLRTAAGELEKPGRRLRDHAAALETAVACGVGVWLHGHIHTGFVNFATAAVPVPQVCAGSSTQRGRPAVTEYTLTGSELEGVRRVYDERGGGFRPAETFTLTLASGGR